VSGPDPSSPFAGAVVVGVDGADPGYAAVRWAAAVAARRDLPLAIVAVHEALNRPGLSGAQAEFDITSTADTAQRIAHRAREVALEAGAFRPRLAIVDDLPPARALVEASRGAYNLVVGNRGAAPLVATLGSTAQHVALHAHCPVTVVRAHQEHPDRDPRVVVGVDGYAGGRAALALAFRVADPAGVVEVVRAEVLTAGELRGQDAAAYAAQVLAQRQADLRSVLGDLPALHPGVRVETAVVWGEAVTVLAEKAAAADVLVVAPRGRR